MHKTNLGFFTEDKLSRNTKYLDANPFLQLYPWCKVVILFQLSQVILKLNFHSLLLKGISYSHSAVIPVNWKPENHFWKTTQFSAANDHLGHVNTYMIQLKVSSLYHNFAVISARNSLNLLDVKPVTTACIINIGITTHQILKICFVSCCYSAMNNSSERSHFLFISRCPMAKTKKNVRYQRFACFSYVYRCLVLSWYAVSSLSRLRPFLLWLMATATDDCTFLVSP